MARLTTRPFVESSVNISLVHRYVYVLTPKVANTTIKRTLQSIELRKTQIRDKSIKVHDRRSSPLLWPAQLPRDMFNAAMSSGDYFIFAFVRNPYSRLLSAYLDKFVYDSPRNVHRRAFLDQLGLPRAHQLGFEEFVDALGRLDPRTMDQHWRPQSLCLFHGAVDYTFVGRFEDLEYQFDVVKDRLFGRRFAREDLGTQTERPHQTGADAKLLEHYTPTLQRKVCDLYREDFLIYGYPMDDLTGGGRSRGLDAVCLCKDGSVALALAERSRAAGELRHALEWYEEAATLGRPEAHYWLGRIRENQGDHSSAVQSYRRGAELGQPTSMRGLARAFQLGRGVAADVVAERAWLERAVSAGDGKAALRLGELDGESTGKDAAVGWFEKAAALGEKRAYYHLGRFHETHQARDRSFEYFRRGAELGDEACMRGLARAYELGRGVGPDQDLAAYWDERAHPERGLAGAPPPTPGHYFVRLPRRVGSAGPNHAVQFLDIVDGMATLGQRQLRRTGYAGYEIDTASTLCTIFGLLREGKIGAHPGSAPPARASEQAPFTFFDVGSNVGHYALLCKALWKQAKVVAFEPAPEVHGWLERVAAANGLEIRAENAALGAEVGQVTLYLSNKSDASNSLNPTFRTHKGQISVRCLTLDGFCTDADVRPDVLKIDVETHEEAVLRGGETLLRRAHPFVVVEVLSKGGRDYGEQLTQLVDRVGGYHYYRITDSPGLEKHSAMRGQARDLLRDWLLSPIELDDGFFERLARWRRSISLCTASTNVPPARGPVPADAAT